MTVNETITKVIIFGVDTGLTSDTFPIMLYGVITVVVLIILAFYFLRC